MRMSRSFRGWVDILGLRGFCTAVLLARFPPDVREVPDARFNVRLGRVPVLRRSRRSMAKVSRSRVCRPLESGFARGPLRPENDVQPGRRRPLGSILRIPLRQSSRPVSECYARAAVVRCLAPVDGARSCAIGASQPFEGRFALCGTSSEVPSPVQRQRECCSAHALRQEQRFERDPHVDQPIGQIGSSLLGPHPAVDGDLDLATRRPQPSDQLTEPLLVQRSRLPAELQGSARWEASQAVARRC